MGFGGSVPCAQTHGQTKFIETHPKEILMEHINDPNHTPKNAIFGANKHEGSFVLGSKIANWLLTNIQLIFTFSDLQFLYPTKQCHIRLILSQIWVHRSPVGCSGHQGWVWSYLWTDSIQIFWRWHAWWLGVDDWQHDQCKTNNIIKVWIYKPNHFSWLEHFSSRPQLMSSWSSTNWREQRISSTHLSIMEPTLCGTSCSPRTSLQSPAVSLMEMNSCTSSQLGSSILMMMIGKLQGLWAIFGLTLLFMGNYKNITFKIISWIWYFKESLCSRSPYW